MGRDIWGDARRGFAADASNGEEVPASSEEEWEDARATQEEEPEGTDEENSFLLKFVQEVKPQVMEQFTAQASPEVVEAMKQTISNMIGTLPAKYFDVTIKTVGENLAQLMLSVMMTGYMFRNAQYRMDVTKTMALPSPSDEEEDEDNTEYAEGSQQLNVEGEVLRWHNEKGAESVDAMEYIEKLERELATLREQLSLHEKASEEKNFLLEYLQRLEPSNMKVLAKERKITQEHHIEAHSLFPSLLFTAPPFFSLSFSPSLSLRSRQSTDSFVFGAVAGGVGDAGAYEWGGRGSCGCDECLHQAAGGHGLRLGGAQGDREPEQLGGDGQAAVLAADRGLLPSNHRGQEGGRKRCRRDEPG